MRVRTVAEAALAAALTVGGAALTMVGAWPMPHPLSAPVAAVAPAPEPASASDPADSGSSEIAGPPVTLEIPAIGVETPLMALGLQRDGTVAVPPLGAKAPAGWYRYGTIPGEPGAAVILGHVDSAREGPAVFYRLRELKPGDLVRVGRTDGRTVVFVVTRTTRYPKRDFPTDAVYGPVNQPELRLITCGGSFDRLRGTYRDNLVVYAELSPGSDWPGDRVESHPWVLRRTVGREPGQRRQFSNNPPMPRTAPHSNDHRE